MKTKNLFILGAAALSLTFAACSKKNAEPIEQTKPASITITIAGESSLTRAKDPAVTIAQENLIKDYTVIVLNATTDKVQAVQSFSSGLTNTVTGLTTGSKKIVVITNTAGSGITLPSIGDNYTSISNPANKLQLSTQSYTKMLLNGFVMSGQSAVTLVSGANTLPGNLKVKRVVAKVKLGEIKVEPIEGHNGVFELKAVHIMKAPSLSNYTPGTITSYAPYHGGTLGAVSAIEDTDLTTYLTDTDRSGRLFYVLPNDNTNSNATLLTVEGEYDGETRYFPVVINDGSGVGGTTDGTFIKRNYTYTINMTIKRPNNGSLDPEVPVDPATLDLTIEAENWTAELIQNVEI